VLRILSTATAVAMAILSASLLASSTGRAFDLQGHRGARGLAPENTLEAFAMALSIGVTTLELDLAMTRDGVLVVHHDRHLNPDQTRGPDGKFLGARGPAIRSITLAELEHYDVGRLKPGSGYARAFPERKAIDGARIPTLEEVFDLIRRRRADHIRFNVETKLTPTSGADTPDPDTFAAAIVQSVRAAGLARRVMIQSMDWRALAVSRRLAPEIDRVCLTVESAGIDNLERGRPGPSPWTAGLDIDDFGGSAARLAHAAGCPVWSPTFRNLTRESLAQAKSLGLSVIPWTVNEPSVMTALIVLGVDGIITDYPDRLRAVMRQRNMSLPPPAPER
jgi:glycerophosphoryl diester phosphodiesterase